MSKLREKAINIFFLFPDPPKITKTPKSGLLLVKKGDSVNLSCQGEGNPKPTITWTRVVSCLFIV